MVKHIVMWKLKDHAHGSTKAVTAELIKSKLESLREKIPGILKLEVGIDFSATAESADVVLNSEFESRDALDAYQAHPDHKAVMPFIKEARGERRMVDYEKI